MAAIDFPNSPSVNDTFAVAGKTWLYNGVSWTLLGMSTSNLLSGSTNTFTTNQIIEGSTTGALLRITQTGAGNALVVEDSANPDSTPFVIDASGNVFAGTANSYGKANIGGTLALHAATPLLNFVDVSNTRLGYLYHDATNISLLNQVAGYVSFGTNNIERMRIDSAGQVGIGVAPAAGRTLTLTKTMTGATTVFGILNNGVIQSDVTTNVTYYRSSINTLAAAFTVPSVYHFHAVQGSIGAGSTVTTQAAFVADGSLQGAGNNLGFYGDIPSAAGRWNLYMSGTANNYLAGRLGVGATLTSGAMAQIVNTTAADKALIVKGAASQTGNLQEWQNSAGTVLAYVAADGSSSFYESDQNILAASIFS